MNKTLNFHEETCLKNANIVIQQWKIIQSAEPKLEFVFYWFKLELGMSEKNT